MSDYDGRSHMRTSGDIQQNSVGVVLELGEGIIDLHDEETKQK